MSYIYNGREGIEGDRESEREREREREKETEYYVAFGRRIADDEAKMRPKNLPDNFPCVDPGPISLGFSRESPAGDMWCFVAYVYNGELVSLIHTLLGAKSLLSVIAG